MRSEAIYTCNICSWGPEGIESHLFMGSHAISATTSSEGTVQVQLQHRNKHWLIEYQVSRVFHSTSLSTCLVLHLGGFAPPRFVTHRAVTEWDECRHLFSGVSWLWAAASASRQATHRRRLSEKMTILSRGLEWGMTLVPLPNSYFYWHTHSKFRLGRGWSELLICWNILHHQDNDDG